MQLRKLGRTGLMVSCIGFGGVPLWSLSEEQARRVLNTALDRGVNFIDTARGYRDSEPLIGMAISHRRNAFYIATKTKARKEKHIKEEFEASLEYLKTEVIDLYQIHYVNSPAELDDVLSNRGALAVLKKIRESGRIRFIGITGHNTDVLSDAAKTGEFDTVQGAFSYIEKDQKMIDLIHYCSRNDVGFIVQKPLAGGAIIRATAGLKWILQYPVATVIPGMPSVEQVIENTGVGEIEFSLSTEELDELDGIVSRLDKNFCRRCYYCQSACPENIRIGAILEFFGKARYPENLVQARRWYRGQKINSLNCTECGLCLVDCPYELPIVDMLKEAHKLLT